MSLDTVKESILVHILTFVSNPRDFRQCAQTCRRFSDVLKDDDVWKYCKGKWTEGVVSNRKRAFQHVENNTSQLNIIRRHQRGLYFQNKRKKLNLEMNYILKVLQVKGWRALLTKILDSKSIAYPHKEGGNKLTRPVLFTLAHLVQSNLIDFLEDANLISIYRGKDHDDQPVVRHDDLVLAEKLHWKRGKARMLFNNKCKDSGTILKGEDAKKRVVIHLLREAGVANEEEKAKETLWLYFITITEGLLKVATLVKEAPYGRFLNNLTPDSIEQAAGRLDLNFCQVYGIPEPEDGEEDCEMCDESSQQSKRPKDDYNSMSSSDVDSDGFSVHSDKDCSDGVGHSISEEYDDDNEGGECEDKDGNEDSGIPDTVVVKTEPSN